MPIDFNITSRTAPEPRAQCAICNEWFPLELIMGHVRGAHGIEEDVATWPDGSVVIVDLTLEPADFESGPDSHRPLNHAEQGTQDGA